MHQLIHQTYLEAGLPNLINRPFANSLAKARKMIDTARKHGAATLCPSAYEYTDATARARAWAEGKRILCYEATNSFDDHPTHGIHGLYMIHRAIVESGNPIASVQFRSELVHPAGRDDLRASRPQGQPGSGHTASHSGCVGHIAGPYARRVWRKAVRHPRRHCFPFEKTEAWAPTIWPYEWMARYKEMPQTFESVWEKTRAFLAGWRSVLDAGRVVQLAEVPEAWESPVALPSRPNDRTVELFKKKKLGEGVANRRTMPAPRPTFRQHAGAATRLTRFT